MLSKKLVTLTLFLIAIFLFISCAKKDDDSSSSTSSFAPPSWIHGAWVDNVSSSTKSGYKFDSSDVYMIMFGQVIENGLVAAGGATEHITSTDSEFSFATGVSCGSGDTSTSGILTYAFTKETTSTLKLIGSSTTSCGSIAETTYTKDTSL